MEGGNPHSEQVESIAKGSAEIRHCTESWPQLSQDPLQSRWENAGFKSRCQCVGTSGFRESEGKSGLLRDASKKRGAVLPDKERWLLFAEHLLCDGSWEMGEGCVCKSSCPCRARGNMPVPRHHKEAWDASFPMKRVAGVACHIQASESQYAFPDFLPPFQQIQPPPVHRREPGEGSGLDPWSF